MMDRRDFIKKIGGATAILTVVPGAIIASRVSTGMARPVPVSKVMTLVSRETIGAVERSALQSSWLAKQDLDFYINWKMQREKALREMIVMEKVHWKTRRKIGKLQYYEPKDFF